MGKERAANRIEMPEELTREWIEHHGFPSPPNSGEPLVFDFSKTQKVDSSGMSMIHLLWQDTSLYRTENISAELKSRIEKEAAVPGRKQRESTKEGFFVRVGDAGLNFFNEVFQALTILSEIVVWSTIKLSKRQFKKGALGEQMYQLGFKALGIVVLLSLLVGVVLSIQTAIQLRNFGADIFLASMIGFSMVRELGPLLTAIILSGRTGSATTAEIATMGVQEEVDALRIMSINPIQFVAVPKFWAITLTMPLLSIIAVASGITGGFFVAVLFLDTTPSLFWDELWKAITVKDFFAGFIRSVIFSWIIIWIGTYYGFKVRGGAEEVGRETTASVVTCIFSIILADAVLSFII
ncbi:MAG: MlaE family ABC transporter permease [Chitinivibrionales bacterium]